MKRDETTMLIGTYIKPREFTEQWEAERLSEYATLSSGGIGRRHPEAKCDYRTEFQRDRDRITHSTAFRRLSHKTQVFISPDGDHYRTRLSHTLEVAQVSRTIARALRLNEDLTEAIALGHDLGHTPFGHTGEDALNEIAPGGFRHYEQSARILEELNLTGEVLDGVFNHSSAGRPGTLEGKIVQLSDKIAYVNHDIDDAIRAGLMKEDDVPEDCRKLLGSSGSSRINFLVSNIIDASMGKNLITLDPEPRRLFSKLRDFMFETVYTNQLVQSEREKISHMIGEIYSYFMKNNSELPSELIKAGETMEKAVVDHIARMTDRYAIKIYAKIAMPESWRRSIL